MDIDFKLTARRLQEAMDKEGLKAIDLSRKSGVLKSSISQFLNARGRPSNTNAKKMAEVLRVNPLWLLGYDVDMEVRNNPLEGISNLSMPAAHPLYIIGEICAGNGIDCQENFTGVFFVDQSIKADYCLKVSGDSMIDANIFDGDIAFIRKASMFIKGRIYAVLVRGENTASLKRVYQQGERLVLMPCNSDYEPSFYDKDEIILIGECIGSFHEQKK